MAGLRSLLWWSVGLSQSTLVYTYARLIRLIRDIVASAEAEPLRADPAGLGERYAGAIALIPPEERWGIKNVVQSILKRRGHPA